MGTCERDPRTAERAAELGIGEDELCQMLLEDDPDQFAEDFTDPEGRALENCARGYSIETAVAEGMTVEEACEASLDRDPAAFLDTWDY